MKVVTAVTEVKDGRIHFVDLAAALQRDDCTVGAYGCYTLAVDILNCLMLTYQYVYHTIPF